MPQISVIVPVYNVEKYIHRCVDSILAQTFKDFELILVDDGSPDNCGAICDEYAKKDPRIHVIHKPNGGLSSARNAGLNVSCGRYIMFCDSDDYVAHTWCELMINTQEQNPGALVVSNILKFEEKIDVSDIPMAFESNSISYFDLYKLGLSGFAVNKIYLKNQIDNLKLRFDERCYYAEDVEFNVKYYSLCNKCIYLSIPLYFYYQHPQSILHRYYPNLLELHLPLFALRLSLIHKNDLPDYCDIWLFQFVKLFDNIFDSRCELPFLQRLIYNQHMIQTPEFSYCINHASGKNESPLVMCILRTRNYYLYWLFDNLAQLKRRIKEALK